MNADIDLTSWSVLNTEVSGSGMLTICTPRMSPTFQSERGVPGNELWQATHVSPMNTGFA